MRDQDEFVRFDEIDDVISSVELLALVLPLLKERPLFWKWAIIGAHGGMQGAMVCVLGATSRIGVLTDRSAEAVRTWHDERREDKEREIGKATYPDEWMAYFNTLLERSRERPAGQTSLELSAAQEIDITRLHEFRNEFAHFKPMTLSIEMAGLPRIVGTAVDCIERLMSSDDVSYKLDDDNKNVRLATAIEKTRRALEFLSS